MAARAGHQRRHRGRPTRPSTGARWRAWSSSPSAAAAITLMVDDVAHLDVVDSVRSSPAVAVRVAIDIDAGLRLGGQHVGPKRSPAVRRRGGGRARPRRSSPAPGFALVGVMTYEGQVAGVPDDVPGPAREVAGGPSAQAGVGRPARGTPPRDRRRPRRARRPRVLERRRLRLRRVHRRRPGRHRGGRRLGAARARAVRPLPVLLPAPGGLLRSPGQPQALPGPRHGARRRPHRLGTRRRRPAARSRGHPRACT